MKNYLFAVGIIFCSFPLASQTEGTVEMNDVVRLHARREILIPDIPGFKTLKCDFHLHTVFSDGVVWPTVRVSEAWENGLDAIAITDHIEGHPKKLPGQKRTQFDVALPLAQSSDIILVRGGEISRGMPPGHFNALFIKDVDALDLPDYMDALAEAIKQGGFILWNHPGWRAQQPDTTKWMKEHEAIYKEGWMHGIEVFNEKEWYPEAIRWAMEKNLAVMANSDVHNFYEYYYDVQKYPVRPITLVFTKERTEESLKEAMFAKRTAALFFDKLVGRKEFIGPIVKQSVIVYPSHSYQDGYAFFTVKNLTDIGFTFIKKGSDKSELPDRFYLPRRSSVILKAKKPRGTTQSYNYILENVLTGVEQYFPYEITVR